MKKIILLMLSMAFVGCEKTAQENQLSSNPNFNVEFLFENKGCKVYRFYDMGRFIYYTDCSNSISYKTGGKNNTIIQNNSNSK